MISLEYKQSGLDRSDGKAVEQNLDLLAHDIRADVLNPRNFSRRFRNDAGDRGQSVNAERAESFQVGLNAGAGAAVRAGNGQRDGTI